MKACKVDLAPSGIYRMFKISEVNACRGNVNDVLLIPTIMQSLNEVQ